MGKLSTAVDNHCVKSVRSRSFSSLYFPAFGLYTERLRISPYSVQMRENADQKNSEYGQFMRLLIRRNIRKIFDDSDSMKFDLFHKCFCQYFSLTHFSLVLHFI